MGAPRGNQNAIGNQGGHPNTYDPFIVGKVKEYIEWCELNPIVIGKTKDTIGEHASTSSERQESPRLPSVAGFARWVKIPRTTLLTWAEAEIEFSTALQDLIDEQERQLIELGRSGEGNSRFAQFMLSAKHDYREKTDVTTQGKEIKSGFSPEDKEMLKEMFSHGHS